MSSLETFPSQPPTTPLQEDSIDTKFYTTNYFGKVLWASFPEIRFPMINVGKFWFLYSVINLVSLYLSYALFFILSVVGTHNALSYLKKSLLRTLGFSLLVIVILYYYSLQFFSYFIYKVSTLKASNMTIYII